MKPQEMDVGRNSPTQQSSPNYLSETHGEFVSGERCSVSKLAVKFEPDFIAHLNPVCNVIWVALRQTVYEYPTVILADLKDRVHG